MNMKAIFAAMNTTARVFIAANISFIFTSLSAVQMYDFHIFTFVYNIYYQSQRSMRSHKLEYSQLKRPMQHVNDLTSVSLALHMPIQPIGEQTACVSRQKMQCNNMSGLRQGSNAFSLCPFF